MRADTAAVVASMQDPANNQEIARASGEPSSAHECPGRRQG
jgi:hypothetical protein